MWWIFSDRHHAVPIIVKEELFTDAVFVFRRRPGFYPRVFIASSLIFTKIHIVRNENALLLEPQTITSVFNLLVWSGPQNKIE